MLKLFDNRNQTGGAWAGLEAWQAPDARLEQAARQNLALEAELEPQLEAVPAAPELEVEPEPELEAELEPEPQHELEAAPKPQTTGSRRPTLKPDSNPTATVKTIAFAGASGGVGKTSAAINVAFELASAGYRVALVDLDIANPTLLAALSQDAITPGLAGVRRLVNQGRFKADDLDRMLMVLNFGGVRISVLPGLSAPATSSEHAELIVVAKSLIAALADSFDYVLLDLPAFSSDSNFALECLSLVDASFAVCAADPVGVQRFLWLLSQIRTLGLHSEPQLLVNGVRDSVLGSNAKRQIADTIVRLTGVEVTAFVPHDQAAFDLALRDGLPLTLAKKASAARHALSMFVRQGLLGQRTNLDWRVARNG